MSDTKHFTIQRHGDKGPNWGALSNILRDLGFGVTVNDADKTEVVFITRPLDTQHAQVIRDVLSDKGEASPVDAPDTEDRAMFRAVLEDMHFNKRGATLERLIEALLVAFDQGVI